MIPALPAARRLHHRGADVVAALTEPADELRGAPAHQMDILQRMNLPIIESASLPSTFELILDTIIGYGLGGFPRGAAADLIRWANAQSAPILALDTPSGLGVTARRAREPTIRAAATLTLALPKMGLLQPQAKPYVGELYLADTRVLPEPYARMGISAPPLFDESDLIRVEA